MLLVSNIPFTTSAVFVAFWQAFQFRERKNFTKSDKKSDKTNKSDRTNKMKSMAAWNNHRANKIGQPSLGF